MHRLTISVVAICVAFSATAAPADIFQWEYINSADPGQGKRQVTTLVPDGAGVDVVPFAQLSNRNLTMAYLIGADLPNAFAFNADLTDADLSQARLANAYLISTKLAGANLTGAHVQGADLSDTTSFGFSAAQLYSTASYQAHDLTGIKLYWNDLSGWNFAGQNLTGAIFGIHALGQAGGQRPPAVLAGTDFAGADLRGANFGGADLPDVNFNTALIQGASFARFVEFCYPACPLAGGITPSQLYSTASYQAKDLSGVGFYGNNLARANFTGQNLTNADFTSAILTDADLAGAVILGARFDRYVGEGTGISLAQLYSTASYQARDLSGISMWLNNLASANLSGQNLVDANFEWATLTGADLSNANLTNVSFGAATLTGADFTGANIQGAHFDKHNYYGPSNLSGTGISPAQLYATANYQARDLSGISLRENDLSGANFAGQNLTNSDLSYATLTGGDFSQSILANVSFYSASLLDADFTGADIRGASFYRIYNAETRMNVGGITLAQLYSTASYQEHDLSGITLSGLNFAGGNFAGQNLTNSRFDVTTLTAADFTAADARGATLRSIDAITTNLIHPNGTINGLDLDDNGLLVVRDYDGSPPIPITVNRQMTIDAGATMQLVLEADAWDSTISFAPGIPVALGGALELTFGDNIHLASQIGRTFQLFDWTGVNPAGTFVIKSQYAWDLSNLYITGEVTLTAIPEPTAITLLIFAATLINLKPRRILL